MQTEIVDKIEGIGPVYADRLAQVGIRTLEDLRGMDIEVMHEKTGISPRNLMSWQSMAMLQQVEGIDPQFSEALVKMGVVDFRVLMDTMTETIFENLTNFQAKGVIPRIASLDEIRLWQERASQIMKGLEKPSRTPSEARVVWETMTCRGMRNYYERSEHPCRWFSQFGPFHAYDISVEDEKAGSIGGVDAFYVGQRYQIPELLSGCRKAPIMSVGLNPNLRAVTQPWRIYPYFDDIQQYAKHFRYRTTFKYSIEDEFYEAHLTADGSAKLEEHQPIPLKKEHVSMYLEYDKLLKAFQQRIGITGASLSLGEDVSYYNFVACHSPRWDMDQETETGIVQECYYLRRFFLGQLVQSMPKVVMIFGKAVMRSFVANFYNAFDKDNVPDPGQIYSDILQNNNYVMRIGGERVRVIFSPHPTGARPWYVRLGAEEKIVGALAEEYSAGNLIYDAEIKHFKRTKGACKFCDNDVFFIGKCRYKGHFEKEDVRPTTEISTERETLANELAVL